MFRSIVFKASHVPSLNSTYSRHCTHLACVVAKCNSSNNYKFNIYPFFVVCIWFVYTYFVFSAYFVKFGNVFILCYIPLSPFKKQQPQPSSLKEIAPCPKPPTSFSTRAEVQPPPLTGAKRGGLTRDKVNELYPI